jgi:predicted CoA-binding protein
MIKEEFNSAAEKFLGLKRIAVAGYSRTGSGTGNAIYKALKTRGYEVFALNPHAEEMEDENCYPCLQDIPGGVEGVVIITNPDRTAEIVLDAAASGVNYIWMHNNTLLPSSVSEKAVEYGKANGMKIIAGGCPMMFLDFGHKCLKWMLGAMGRMPSVENFSKN